MSSTRLWLWKHPLTERVYVSTVQPGPRARQGLAADGYKLYAVDVQLPDEPIVPDQDAVVSASVTACEPE